MSQEDNLLNMLIEQASSRIENSRNISLSNPEIRRRIETELKPVLQQLKAMIQEVAQTIAAGGQNQLDLVRRDC